MSPNRDFRKQENNKSWTSWEGNPYHCYQMSAVHKLEHWVQQQRNDLLGCEEKCLPICPKH